MGDRDSSVSLHEKKSNRDAYSKKECNGHLVSYCTAEVHENINSFEKDIREQNKFLKRKVRNIFRKQGLILI